MTWHKAVGKKFDVESNEWWGFSEFFREIAKLAQEDPQLIPGRLERMYVYHTASYFYMVYEDRSRAVDLDYVQKHWKTLQPILKKTNLMAEFRNDKHLIEQINQFVEKGVRSKI